MKAGKSLVELAATLEDIRLNSKDLIVPVTKMGMNERAEIEIHNGASVTHVKPSSYAHSQLASWAGIPKAYYDRLQTENRGLLSDNFNHAVEMKTPPEGFGKPEQRMVRLHRDGLRAFLSSSYRRLDSYDMLQTVLPILSDKGLQVTSSELTDSRLYLKALSPKITTEIKKGDAVQFGLVISNSDVGAGSVRVEPLIYRLVCANGLIMETAIRKTHVGKNLAGDDIQELLSRETLDTTEKAFWMQVRDVVLAELNPERFESKVNLLREAAERKITNYDLVEVVELTAKQIDISGEKTLENMVAYLANGADGAGLTQWGLMNAVTYAAHQDAVGYDTSIDLERKASKILTLNERQWRKIAEVA